MRKRAAAAVGSFLILAFLVLAGSASAATVVGDECTAQQGLLATTVSLAGSPANPYPTTVPAAGVITSWSIHNAFVEPAPTQRLKVFRPTGVPRQVTVVGESDLEPIALGSNTFATRVPVKAGDQIGLAGYFGVATFSGSLYCRNAGPGSVLGWIEGNAPVGSTATVEEEPGGASPVTVTVEPDADGDGYGDETQDKCPTDASTQGACPTPPAGSGDSGGSGSTRGGSPPAGSTSSQSATLKAAGVARKRLVIVDLTTTAQATVTVHGTVRVGKGKPVTLTGVTQNVAPGVLARFTLRFPPRLMAALKRLPKSKKLTLRLAASAPGATTTNLTVRVPGQKPPPHQRHGK